jgi:hypothetical protein
MDEGMKRVVDWVDAALHARDVEQEDLRATVRRLETIARDLAAEVRRLRSTEDA